MKVLLTHGYFLEEDEKEKQIMRPYPPLGILSISAYLEKHGMENEIIDSTFITKKDFYNKLLEMKPGYVGIYVNLMTKLNVLEIIKFICGNNMLKDTKIILGGPEVRYYSEDYLKCGANFLVFGEGEETLHELICTLDSNNKNKISEVEGIGFLNEDGMVVKTSERNKIADIDELPFPNRSKIKVQLYLETWKQHHGASSLSINTMRGCPYTCKWCSRAVYGMSYRRRSPVKVVDELEIIKKEYNPDMLWFVDDVFTISHKWLEEFAAELEKRKINISYECITRSDRMNEKVISLMKKSGCKKVWIGAESGSQKVIDLMNRRVNVDNVRDMIILTKKYGIEVGTFIMLGYPGETEKDIEETIRHLKLSSPDHFTITVAYPIKGTEMFLEIEQNLSGNYDFENNTDRDRDFKRMYNTKYYHHAVRRVSGEFNFHKMKAKGRLFTLPSIKYKMVSIAAKAGMIFERARSG